MAGLPVVARISLRAIPRLTDLVIVEWALEVAVGPRFA